MRVVAAIIATLAVLGQLSARDGTRVAGYETYAVVAPVSDEAEAQPFAQRHCAKYDRLPISGAWMDLVPYSIAARKTSARSR